MHVLKKRLALFVAHSGTLVGVPAVDGALDLDIEVSDRSEIRLGPHSSLSEFDVAVHQGCFAFPRLHRPRTEPAGGKTSGLGQLSDILHQSKVIVREDR